MATTGVAMDGLDGPINRATGILVKPESPNSQAIQTPLQLPKLDVTGWAVRSWDFLMMPGKSLLGELIFLLPAGLLYGLTSLG
jgi:hypothetical protein